ncbi:MAG: lysine--tRNA ligase [Candidatus Marsarchaeota archaeon]|jgi:lysyl-tRNA synthetase class 2|nr:lysine--tRNA ligase [Candidatus Marsarchaeota archaeon]MCL5418496.1 lysine--tRNA ligase [Candidatus Marsarchaeota archaeon]
MASNNESVFSGLPYSYSVNAHAAEIKQAYADYEGKQVSVAGRITGMRKSGKLIFIDVLDATGKIQAYFDFAQLGERFEAVKKFNSGDIIGAKGKVFKTKPGEISINVEEYSLLAKAMRMLPDKWHGLQDVELRYRKRYLDLIMNPAVSEIFIKRSKIVSLIRKFLDSKGFMEFETPVIQPLYGGADADPFKVFVNTLGEEDYLRISNELYLKRLIIGGLEKVYEIYKAFRNEDIDVTHSPEFTMIEWYQAYADYEEMMKLSESLLEYIAKNLYGSTEITYQGKKIDFRAPFARVKYVDSINERAGNGIDVLELGDEELFKLAESKGIKFEKGKRTRSHAYEKLFEALVQPTLVQPAFAIDFPKETSTLTRSKRGDPRLVERFELYIAGMELANAYSELNDPVVQRQNFESQIAAANAAGGTAEPLDMDFVEAMEYGMPPTGGLGLGIDRLVMLLTDKPSIKEVILFPMEKRSGQK